MHSIMSGPIPQSGSWNTDYQKHIKCLYWNQCIAGIHFSIGLIDPTRKMAFVCIYVKADTEATTQIFFSSSCYVNKSTYNTAIYNNVLQIYQMSKSWSIIELNPIAITPASIVNNEMLFPKDWKTAVYPLDNTQCTQCKMNIHIVNRVVYLKWRWVV